MIGSKGTKGAIVYGIYSFFDKIANGLIIYLALRTQMFIDKDPNLLRVLAAWLPGGCGIVAWALAMFLKVKDYKDKEGNL